MEVSVMWLQFGFDWIGSFFSEPAFTLSLQMEIPAYSSFLEEFDKTFYSSVWVEIPVM